jgi:LCP family protein required for cell wall assembly
MSRRILAVTLALAAWVGGTVVGSFGTAPAAGVPILQVGRAHAEFQPSVTTDEPIFVLILGSDSRPGTPIDGGLADSIHILGINPVERRGTLYGIPRDSYVPLASGGSNKINTAMPAGGVEAMIATVEQLTGITFDYYMLAGFEGFRDAVDDVGGLRVDVPYPFAGHVRTQFEEGPMTMTGDEALEFGRTRKSLPRGDFDRSLNQGVLMLSALSQFREQYGKDAGQMFTWLGAGARNVQLDVSLDELMRFAEFSRSFKPKNVTNLVALGTVGSVSGMSIVNLTDENQALWADLAMDGYILPADVPDAAKAQS